MPSVLPSLIDKFRNKRNGEKRYVGQVIKFDGSRRTVIAEVYGDSIEEMRARKKLCCDALANAENG